MEVADTHQESKTDLIQRCFFIVKNIERGLLCLSNILIQTKSGGRATVKILWDIRTLEISNIFILEKDFRHRSVQISYSKEIITLSTFTLNRDPVKTVLLFFYPAVIRTNLALFLL